MTEAQGARAAGGARRRAMTIALAVLLALGLAYGLWWWLVGSRFVTTDDAYVGADAAQVTPLTSGTVKAVLVRETQPVRAGDALVRLDDVDARLEVAQAQAELGKSQRRVRQYEADDTSLGGQLAARYTDIAHAEAQLAQARSSAERAALDLSRREKVASTGAISQEELSTARDQAAGARATLDAAQAALAEARANLVAARGQLAANHVLVEGVDERANPEVASSQAKLDQARLDLARTVVTAPIDGIISKRQVQVGQRVTTGAVLMSVTPIQDAYVDANFKEVQLEGVRVGQDVELTSDLYGDGVRFHGRVLGFSGGTGSAFAVIPSQNATGNWIKVVQRLAVRIGLDPGELARHPLRVGLSMKAKIDVSGHGG